MRRIVFVSVLLICVSSYIVVFCSKVERIKEPFKNPTSYVFEASLPRVKSAIKEQFSDLQFKQMELFFKESDSYYKFTPIITTPSNKDDFYLDKWGMAIGGSNTHFMDGKSLPYIASFHIHITAIDSIQTRVEVFTHDSKVITGKQFLPLAHGKRAFEYEEVEPSTVEEYEILLKIGEELGEKNMSPIKKGLSKY